MARLLSSSLLLLAITVGSAHAAAPPSADAAGARLEQQWLPSLAERKASAAARIVAAEAWFSGTSSLASAFPALADAPLGDPAFLAGQRLALQDAAEERALERVSEPSAGLSPRDRARLVDARSAALDAEERADMLVDRLLAGVAAAVARAPDLQEGAVASVVAGYAARRALPDGVPESDPGWQAAAAQAASAGAAEAALRRVQAAAWRAATIPGDTTLVDLVAQDLAAGADDAFTESAMRDRLTAVRPLLPEALGEQVDARLVALDQAGLRRRIAEARAALSAPPSGLPGDLAGLETAILGAEADAQAAAAALDVAPAAGSDPDSLDGLRRQAADLQRQVAEHRLQALRGALEQARGVATPATGTSEEDVAAARAKADQARQAADDAQTAGQANVALLRGKVAELAAMEAGILEAEHARNAQALADLGALAERLQTRRLNAESAQSMAPRDRERPAAVDNAFLELRRSVDEVHDEVLRRSAKRKELVADRDRILSGLPEAPVGSAGGESDLVAVASEYSRARAGVAAALAQRDENATAELDMAIDLLDAAKRDRRQARTEASTQARGTSRSGWIPEVAKEIQEVPLLLGHWWRGSWAWVRAVPEKLTDLNAVWAFLRQSFKLVLLFAVWLALRGRGPDWTEAMLEGVHNSRERAGALSAARWTCCCSGCSMRRWSTDGRRWASSCWCWSAGPCWPCCPLPSAWLWPCPGSDARPFAG